MFVPDLSSASSSATGQTRSDRSADTSQRGPEGRVEAKRASPFADLVGQDGKFAHEPSAPPPAEAVGLPDPTLGELADGAQADAGSPQAAFVAEGELAGEPFSPETPLSEDREEIDFADFAAISSNSAIGAPSAPSHLATFALSGVSHSQVQSSDATLAQHQSIATPAPEMGLQAWSEDEFSHSGADVTVASPASAAKAALPEPSFARASDSVNTFGAPFESASASRLESAESQARAETRAPAGPATIQNAREVIGQISVAVGKAEGEIVELRLDPPELGRVQIRLSVTETGLQASLFSERPETHDMLRRNAEMLARQLSEAGYENVTLDFTAGQEFQSEQRAQSTAALSSLASSACISPAANAVAPTRVATGALDIRL